MLMALAIARPVQWVAWCGGVVQVNASTRAVVCAAIDRPGALRPSGLARYRLILVRTDKPERRLCVRSGDLRRDARRRGKKRRLHPFAGAYNNRQTRHYRTSS